MKIAVSTDKAPAAIGPYSQGIRAGGLVITSGQLPIDPATGSFPEGIEAQTRQSLLNCQAVLQAGGAELENVIKTTVFLADLSDFSKVNAVYETFFEAPYPARSCVQVAAIPKGAGIEIECIAVVD